MVAMPLLKAKAEADVQTPQSFINSFGGGQEEALTAKALAGQQSCSDPRSPHYRVDYVGRHMQSTKVRHLWTLCLVGEPQETKIELEHSKLTGEKRVLIDDDEVFATKERCLQWTWQHTPSQLRIVVRSENCNHQLVYEEHDCGTAIGGTAADSSASTTADSIDFAVGPDSPPCPSAEGLLYQGTAAAVLQGSSVTSWVSDRPWWTPQREQKPRRDRITYSSRSCGASNQRASSVRCSRGCRGRRTGSVDRNICTSTFPRHTGASTFPTLEMEELPLLEESTGASDTHEQSPERQQPLLQQQQPSEQQQLSEAFDGTDCVDRPLGCLTVSHTTTGAAVVTGGGLGAVIISGDTIADENARLHAMLGERDAQIAVLEGQLRRCTRGVPEQQQLELTRCGVPLSAHVQKYLMAELAPPVATKTVAAQQASAECMSPRPQSTAATSADAIAPSVLVQQTAAMHQTPTMGNWHPIDDEDLDVTQQCGPVVPSGGSSPKVDASVTEAHSRCGSCCGGSRRGTEPPLLSRPQTPQPVLASAPQQVAVQVEKLASVVSSAAAQLHSRSLSTPPAAHLSSSSSMPGHLTAVSYAAPSGSTQAERVRSVPRQPLPQPLHPPQAHPPHQATAWRRVATPKQHRAWNPRCSPAQVHRAIRTRVPSEGPPAPTCHSAWPLALLGRQQPFWQSPQRGHAQVRSQTGPWAAATVSSAPRASHATGGSGPETAAGRQQQGSPAATPLDRQQLALRLLGPSGHHTSHKSLLLQGPLLKPAGASIFPAARVRC